MHVSRMSKASKSAERATFEVLVSRYRSDPEIFERHFPDVEQILRQVVEPNRVSRPHFGLTDREKAHHVEALSDVMNMPEPPSQDAVNALECCAILIQDDFMTPHVNHQLVVSLFKAAFGKALGSIKKNMSIPINRRGAGEPIHHSSLVRGVVADLDLGMRLVSITVTPRKVREGNKMMGIVGIGRDLCPDVATRHDDYLAEQGPHGSS